MRYVALLRGINVGTSGRIRMDALVLLLEEAGFAHVSTYIQSGNVLFDSPLSEADAKETIERALKDRAITTVAIVRTESELLQVIEDRPFSETEIVSAQQANTEGESLYVCLLPREPNEQELQKLHAIEPSDDLCSIAGRTVYLLLRQSIRVSKLAQRVQRIFPEMTVRNWNTMLKISELASQR